MNHSEEERRHGESLPGPKQTLAQSFPPPTTLEAIKRRPLAEPDCAELQERVATQAEKNPDTILQRYVADPRSFGGRYVNSDLMKEMLPEYSQSRESRSRYNSAVHNTAATLASEQFRRALADTSNPSRNVAYFVTGIPGAGKSTAFAKGEPPASARVVYEGQLANLRVAEQKIDAAVRAGTVPSVTVVHIEPEAALTKVIHRHSDIGRGATIEAMARIQGNLPNALQAIHNKFGQRVRFSLLDRRDNETKTARGWCHLRQLESEGTYEEIRQRLRYDLERRHRAGEISEDTYRAILGEVPGSTGLSGGRPTSRSGGPGGGGVPGTRSETPEGTRQQEPVLGGRFPAND